VRGPGWLRCWVGPVSRRLIGRGRARVCGVVFGRGGLSLLPAWFWYRGDGGSGSRDGKMVCPTLAGVRYVHCALAGCYIFVLFHCYCCYLEYSLTNALLMKLSRERRNDTNKFTAVLRCRTPVPNSKKRPLQSPRTQTQHTTAHSSAAHTHAPRLVLERPCRVMFEPRRRQDARRGPTAPVARRRRGQQYTAARILRATCSRSERAAAVFLGKHDSRYPSAAR
jgi:hypothetical protein